MDHFYEGIEPNWFDYLAVYERMVNHANDGAHFVEVGGHMGRSAAFMAVTIINSGKKIKFDVIDNFAFYDLYEKSAEIFNKNLLPVAGHYNLIVANTPEIATTYDDKSLDFVWIDAAHKYDDVVKDVAAWYPKVKHGGYLGGHDWPGDPDDIERAVKDNGLTAEIYQGSMTKSWLHYKW